MAYQNPPCLVVRHQGNLGQQNSLPLATRVYAHCGALFWGRTRACFLCFFAIATQSILAELARCGALSACDRGSLHETTLLHGKITRLSAWKPLIPGQNRLLSFISAAVPVPGLGPPRRIYLGTEPKRGRLPF